MQNKASDTVVSGMRATGALHLGHWHGVIENWLKLQNEFEGRCYYFVADFHRLTTQFTDSIDIRSVSRAIILDWLSLGLNPEKAVLFIQSDVPEHAELHLYLSMITPVGWLERVPSYKDYVASLSSQEGASYGFLGYAVLQTADIALYGGTHVPIGQDQAAHLEVSREIVRRFNHKVGQELLNEPKPLFTSSPSLIGTDGRKMSKSYNNGVWLSDAGDELEKKILKYVTDPARIKKTDPGNPALCPVFDFHKIYSSDSEQNQVIEGCTKAQMGCVDCKRLLLKNLKAKLEPVQAKRQELSHQTHRVDEILKHGADLAKTKAQKTIRDVKKAMGL